MLKHRVYLSGPMAGVTYEHALAWRSLAQQLLGPEIECYSPLRFKEYCAGRTFDNTTQYTEPLSRQKVMFERDFRDTIKADALLVNLLGATAVSIGTTMEIAWAKAFQIPVIVAMEPQGNPHVSPLLLESCTCVVDTLEGAVKAVREFLLAQMRTSINGQQ